MRHPNTFVFFLTPLTRPPRCSYIGRQDDRTYRNLLMSYNQCGFYCYTPCRDKLRKETLSISRILMQRYYLIQKARDADTVGIVAGTLGVSEYLDVIARLRGVAALAGKKTYTFLMGKLNVAKMANFTEIDCFVLVACPESSLVSGPPPLQAEPLSSLRHARSQPIRVLSASLCAEAPARLTQHDACARHATHGAAGLQGVYAAGGDSV